MSDNNTFPGSAGELSSPFRELLSAKPHFLVKRSVFLCSGIFLLLFAMTYLIRYPKILTTSGKVIPMEKPDGVYTRGYIPEGYVNQVKPGLDVLIKLDAYPFTEFGLLKGRVWSVSPKLSDSGYLVLCTLPQGMAGPGREKMRYQEGMGARVEIILENKRLIQMFF